MTLYTIEIVRDVWEADDGQTIYQLPGQEPPQPFWKFQHCRKNQTVTIPALLPSEIEKLVEQVG